MIQLQHQAHDAEHVGVAADRSCDDVSVAQAERPAAPSAATAPMNCRRSMKFSLTMDRFLSASPFRLANNFAIDDPPVYSFDFLRSWVESTIDQRCAE